MVALDEFWPTSVGAIRSITMEVVTAIFALASLSSLLVAVHVSVICTSLVPANSGSSCCRFQRLLRF